MCDEVGNVPAVEEAEYFVEKWCACEDGALGPFAPKECLAESFADDKTAIIKRWGVFCQPDRYLGFPGGRE